LEIATDPVTTRPDPNSPLPAESGSPPAPALPPVEAAHRTVIEPPAGWQWINFGELWKFRELLFFLAWRDIKVRYKQTVLGAAWAVLQPAMMMAVFTIFFGRLAGLNSGGVAYPLFALCGLLPWFFFSQSISLGSNSVLGAERLITKIYFPRLAVPFASVGACVFDFLISLSLLVVVLAFYATVPSWQIVYLPLVFVLLLFTATGLGTLLAALNVSYRDFRYVVPFFIQLGMFATPTIYMQPKGDEGPVFQTLVLLNPVASLVGAFRACVLGGPIPWVGLGVAAGVALVIFFLGCFYFRKVEDRFADII
jgi:lipopolysaccharide transport system permease protein